MSDDRAEPARLAVDGAVATITLNRPDRFNAVDVATARALRAHGETVRRDDGIRALVIRGAGSAFCAGGDIGAFLDAIDEPSRAIEPILAELHPFLLGLHAMGTPVITRLHGAVAGAGLSLAFMGDFAIAADTTRFVAGYGKLGVSPDGGGTVGIPAAVGRRIAMRIFLARDGFDAREAEAWGLLDAVVPEAELDDAVAALAGRLARMPPEAVAATKRLLAMPAAAMEAQLEAERVALLACARTDSFRDNVRRFAGKK